MNNTRQKKDPPKQTISDELFSQWQECTRRSDVKDMAQALGYSVPVINQALKHGRVKQPELVGAITNYFAARLEKEREDAQKLKSLRGDVQ